MKLKVCGMRETTNLESLIELNPDFIGFIFYDKSKRYVKVLPEVYIPSHIAKVGVFVNESYENIRRIVDVFQLKYIQLHGNESVTYCEELKKLLDKFGTKIIKAFAIDKDFDFAKTQSYEDCSDLFLFDTKGQGYGGTGMKFNWSLLDNYNGKHKFLLSGGIGLNDSSTIANLSHHKLLGIDINSGFEIEQGLKDIEKIRKFKSQLR